jgi:hypothetical protein
MAVIKKHPKEIKQVALSIRNVASAIAPRDTGNLRNVLRQYNTPERMIKYLPNGSATITFFQGPPGASYGVFWNDPPAIKSKQRRSLKRNNSQHFNYGSKSLKDPEVKAKIKDYAKALGKQVATQLAQSIRKK